MDLVWETESGALEAISFDATLREVHSATATPTTNLIEGGADHVDHVKIESWRGSFECFVSDSPSDVPATQMFGTNGALTGSTLSAKRRELKTGAHRRTAATYEDKPANASANVLSFSGPVSRRERILEQLELLRTNRTLLTASMILAQRENVVITNIGASLDSKTGDGVTFSLELAQLRFAETQIVEVPDPEEPRGRPPVDGGAVSATEATPALQSTLYTQTFGR